MPKLTCPCGHVHNLSPIPDDGWVVIRDKDFETLIEAELASVSGDKKLGPRRIGLLGRLYECPKCGRLMWSLSGDRCSKFKVFKPEDDGPGSST